MKFKGFLKLHSQEISNIQKIIDPFIISILFKYIVGIPLNNVFNDLNFTLLILIFSLLILPKTSLYKSCRNKSLTKVSKEIVKTWALLMAFISILFFVLKVGIYFSRIQIFVWSILVLIFLIIHHVIIRKILRIYRIKGGNIKKIIFCGSYKELKSLNKNLDDNPWLGLKIVSWFTTSSEESEYKKVSIYKGSLTKFKDYDFNNEVDEIIFGIDNAKNADEVLNLLGDTTIPISYFPIWASLDMKLYTEKIGNKFIVRLWGHNINAISFIFKRIGDILISLVLIFCFSPLFILISILIKLNSKGPILFLQSRAGIDGKSFQIYKFRTMFHNEHIGDKEIKQATKFDKRVTKIGKTLRKWSLDELPQLINVLKGDMSIVGPRPHAIEHNNYYRKYIRGYMQRHFFKPGITGLAQINGYRGETKNIRLMEQRIENDLTYINNWSFLLDLEILIKTSYKFASKKAY